MVRDYAHRGSKITRVRDPADVQNPLLAAANANRNPNDDDTLSDYVPESRDISVSRAVSLVFCQHQRIQFTDKQPSAGATDSHHINTAPQSLMESDGEDELVDEDEEFDEDAIAGGSVSSRPRKERGKLMRRKSLHRRKDVRIR